MAVDTSIFKDYDVRGVYPKQINGPAFSEIANAIVRQFSPKSVAICRDMRLSGTEIRDAMAAEFALLGVNVADAGVVGTEMQYFIAGTMDYDLVIMISASHNPPEYNGIKMVKKGPVAVTSESGMYAVRDLLSQPKLPPASVPGKISEIDVWQGWHDKVWSLVDKSTIGKLKVVVDAGNGMGGVLSKKILGDTGVDATYINYEPDGHFPNHVPNPLIPENNRQLGETILKEKADVGLTFDGDADRMFLVDDKGRMVSGTITTALLAKYILAKHPGELILYNAICGRIVPQTIEKFGGKSKRVRVGHSYIKTYMRETGAIFAGEHSGHYYHRDFFMAESGILTALMVLSLLSREGRKLSDMVDELSVYPASNEMNFIVADIPKAVEAIKTGFPDAKSVDELDGITVWYDTYWFNVRASKTEPLLRLNVEADSRELLDEKVSGLVAKIEGLGGKRK